MILAPDHLRLFQQLLAQHVPELEVWAFGSRVVGNPKPHSDLDLALVNQQPIAVDRLARLSLEFEESDLPFRLDLVELSTTTPAFRAIIERDHEVIQRGTSTRD
ncbi:MAG TPA: nucleotidyltransferase domain-containing protein [Polyangiaceae bacterium]|nr:nucleotidyltransferase domain-containing protein [Polyangiaceae bacterium]